MKPSAMLYRNLLAIEIEEMVRANPLDGLVILANCDKSVPGALMGAISANIPTVLVTGGARPVASFRGAPVGTGTALWRLWDERRAGRLDDEAWRELEQCLSCGRGACNTMGTASTMAVLSEVLGLMVPGASSIPAGDPRAAVSARRAGELAVSAVTGGGRRPRDILTEGCVRQRDRRAARDRRLDQRRDPPGGAGWPGRGAVRAGRHPQARRARSGARRRRAVRFRADARLRRGRRGAVAATRDLRPARPDCGTVTGAAVGDIVGAAAAAKRRDQASAASPLREGGAFGVVSAARWRRTAP